MHNIAFTEVFAYPSYGGHIRKRVSRIELDWLGPTSGSEHESSNANTPVASNRIHAHQHPDTEDAFSLRLMQIGGTGGRLRRFMSIIVQATGLTAIITRRTLRLASLLRERFSSYEVLQGHLCTMMNYPRALLRDQIHGRASDCVSLCESVAVCFAVSKQCRTAR